MFTWLTQRTASKRKAEAIYGKVVAAARQPQFFGPGRVADTPEGRYALVALHLFLAVERVKALAPAGEDIARQTIEAFVTDMDDCMREMGVGDLTVPKRVKRAAAAFYERAAEYRAALADTSPSGDAALIEILTREVLNAPADAGFAADMAHYVRHTHARLASLSTADMESGSFDFATPPANR